MDLSPRRVKIAGAGDLEAAIAPVARSRGDILVTHNTRDFINIPGLQLEDWLEAD